MLIIDRDGVAQMKTAKSLCFSLLSCENLWQHPNFKDSGGIYTISDTNGVELSIQALTLDKTNIETSAAFIIKMSSEILESIEPLRIKLVRFLKEKLDFTHINILRDEISAFISSRVYPMIHQVENSLRSYLIKFFTQKVGIDWFENIVHQKINEKANNRISNDRTFSPFINTEVMMIDFLDLGSLIYRPMAAVKNDVLLESIMAGNDEQLEKLKEQLKNNYSNHFKKTFLENDFEAKWSKLAKLRNRVAHNSIFTMFDYNNCKNIVQEVNEMIAEATRKTGDLKIGAEPVIRVNLNSFEMPVVQEVVADKALIEKKALSKIREVDEVIDEDEVVDEGQPIVSNIKVVGKIDLQNEGRFNAIRRHVAVTTSSKDIDPLNLDVISEDDFLEMLGTSIQFIKNRQMPYLGVSAFLKHCEVKGFSKESAQLRLSYFVNQKYIEVYDIPNPEMPHRPIKAVRFAKVPKTKK